MHVGGGRRRPSKVSIALHYIQPFLPLYRCQTRFRLLGILHRDRRDFTRNPALRLCQRPSDC